jgi:hypothetical protein
MLVMTQDNIKIYLRDTGCKEMGCICLVQDMDKWCSLVNPVMNHQIPYNVGNLTSLGTISFSMTLLCSVVTGINSSCTSPLLSTHIYLTVFLTLEPLSLP